MKKGLEGILRKYKFYLIALLVGVILLIVGLFLVHTYFTPSGIHTDPQRVLSPIPIAAETIVCNHDWFGPARGGNWGDNITVTLRNLDPGAGLNEGLYITGDMGNKLTNTSLINIEKGGWKNITFANATAEPGYLTPGNNYIIEGGYDIGQAQVVC